MSLSWKSALWHKWRDHGTYIYNAWAGGPFFERATRSRPTCNRRRGPRFIYLIPPSRTNWGRIYVRLSRNRETAKRLLLQRCSKYIGFGRAAAAVAECLSNEGLQDLLSSRPETIRDRHFKCSRAARGDLLIPRALTVSPPLEGTLLRGRRFSRASSYSAKAGR